MRKINISDAFRFSRLLKVTHSKEAISRVLGQIAAAKAQNAANPGDKTDAWLYQLGIDAALTILDCAAEAGAEKACYDFLAPVWECNADDIKAMTLDKFAENIQTMFRENDMSAFFNSAQKMGR